MKKTILLLLIVLFMIQQSPAQTALCFSPAQEVPFSINTLSRCLAKADFNNDGQQDICSQADGINLLLSNGSGSYAASTNFTVGTITDFVLTADFNNDGNADAAAINFNDSTIFIFSGNGLGGISSISNFKVPADPRAMVAADFNNDNKMDLATANYSASSVSVFLSASGGNFSSAINYSVPNNPSLLLAEDFNNNGATDIFVITNSTSGMLKGNGNGTFSVTANLSLQALFAITAKINNDSYPDFIDINNNGIVSVRLGNGNYSFGVPITINSAIVSDVKAADFNNDGKMDLAAMSGYTTQVLPGMGNGNFGTPQTYTTVPSLFPCFTFLPVDVNNDGKMDIIYSTDNNPAPSYLLNCNTAEVGIESYAATDEAVMVFPNPFADKLNIKAETAELFYVFIYTTLGQLVCSDTMSARKKTFDLSFLSSGIYYLKLNGNGKNSVAKIIKE